jgi:hypothetical protein
MLSSLHAFLVELPPATHLLTFLTIASLSQLAIMRSFEPRRCRGRFCLRRRHCLSCRVALFCANILEGVCQKKRNLGLRKWKKLRKKRPTPKNHVHSVGSYPAQITVVHGECSSTCVVARKAALLLPQAKIPATTTTTIAPSCCTSSPALLLPRAKIPTTMTTAIAPCASSSLPALRLENIFPLNKSAVQRPRKELKFRMQFY